MRMYRDKDARGGADEITVIEDASVVSVDDDGVERPGYRYIDEQTICAHPQIIDALLKDAERVWTLEEILADLP